MINVKNIGDISNSYVSNLNNEITNGQNSRVYKESGATRRKNRLLWIVAAVVVILSIAVINLYCNGLEINSNNAGVIISSLCVVVTLILGWQIYSALDLERRIITQTRMNIKNAVAESFQVTLCITFAQLGVAQLERGEVEQATRSLFNALNTGYVDNELYQSARDHAIDALKTMIHDLETSAKQGNEISIIANPEDVKAYLIAALKLDDPEILKFVRRIEINSQTKQSNL